MSQYFENDENLKSEIHKVNVNIVNTNYYFYTDNGVFSKGKLDLGTKILLESLDLKNTQHSNILDIGCGCGPIGIYLVKQGFTVDMSDVNKRALHLTRKALKEQKLEAKVLESDSYQNIKEKYDCIISNPPIRVGKKILYDIVMNAKKYLNQDGELWIVVRKKQGAESLIIDMRSIYTTVQIIKKKKGYFIIKAK